MIGTAPVRAAALPVAASTATTGLRLQLSGEEPSGVYFERDTLQTQTALVFSVRAWNDRPVERPLSLSWRVQDAMGRTLWQRSMRLAMPPRAVIHRREMFEPPRLGAYRVSVRATAERGGQQGRTREVSLAALPFAVVTAPASGLRPHSFFALSTPALLSTNDLDFYARIGARVLRSSWVMPDDAGESGGAAARDFGLLDRQLQARLQRGLATRAVLPVFDGPPSGAALSGAAMAGEGEPHLEEGAGRAVPVAGRRLASGGRSAQGDRFVPVSRFAPRSLMPFLVRYNDITTWEFAGIAPPARWDALARDARALRSDVSLLGPLGTSDAPPAGGWDGVVVPLPLDASLQALPLTKRNVAPADSPAFWRAPQTSSPNVSPYSAPSLRALLGLESQARRLSAMTGAARQLYFAQNEASNEQAAPGAMAGAKAMVTRYMLGILSGAAGMSAPLPAPTAVSAPVPATMNAAAMRAWENGESDANLTRMAQAAAFSTMTRLLEDTSPGSALFPASPLLWGIEFDKSGAASEAGSRRVNGSRNTSSRSAGSRIAVLWADGEQLGDSKRNGDNDAAWPPVDVSRARVVVRLGEARAFDVFGNEVARSRRGKLVVPLGLAPVYVVGAANSSNPPGSSRAAWTRAWREARTEGLPPLAAQVLALTQLPQSPSSPHQANPRAGAPARAVSAVAASSGSSGSSSAASSAGSAASSAPRAPQSLRVRLQNVLNQPLSGVLRVTPPPGWQLANESRNFRLAAGESRVYGFAVNRSVVAPGGAYPLTVEARGAGGRWQWKQTARVATAQSVRRGQTLRVDGDLSDWRDASWMEVSTRNAATRNAATRNAATRAAVSDSAMSVRETGTSATRAAPIVSARVALRWDAQRLYIAARVSEPHLQPRRAGSDYEFWRGYDALQLAFGLRDEPSAAPRRAPFRDTDYGFLLCPFDVTASGAIALERIGTGADDANADAGAKIEGRLLRLWNPALTFDAARDHVRWGGIVPASQCVVRRDIAHRVTIYEVSLPLDEMPGLKPAMRAARDVPVRFGWILHTDESLALQSSRAAGVFPWWGNTGSFLPSQGLPAQELQLAAQTPLGFTQRGPLSDGAADDIASDIARDDAPSFSWPRVTPARNTSTPRGNSPASRPGGGARRSVRKPRSGRTAPRRAPNNEPPEIAPMPPRVLPPVSPSPNATGGVPLPPAPVRSEPLPPLPPSP